MYCPNCGSDNPAEVKFCRRCGIGLSGISEVLAGKAENRSLTNPRLAQLIKDYYSGRHQIMLGSLSIASGVALLTIIFAMGKWGFFWIFLWVFMALFGNGIRQFTKGWNKWSDASVELKAMGYAKPPTGIPESAQNHSRLITEPRITESLPSQPAILSQPPSVTESTTRHLETREKR